MTSFKEIFKNTDVLEDTLLHLIGHPIEVDGHSFESLLHILLRDWSSEGGNIMWCTDDYAGHKHDDEIGVEDITGLNGRVIVPRVCKSKVEQKRRIKDKAEVFTPMWICNWQNNLYDDTVFKRQNVFNVPSVDHHTWTPTNEKILFPDTMTWKKYIDSKVLEFCCGEAPYLVSRYDVVNGNEVPLKDRVGLLDRKLRIVREQTHSIADWKRYALRALQGTYGFEWQGDNILLARENMLATFIDYFYDAHPRGCLTEEDIINASYVISWNIWQMDGLTGETPYEVLSSKKKDLFTVYSRAKVEALVASWENPENPLDPKSQTFNSLKKQPK